MYDFKLNQTTIVGLDIIYYLENFHVSCGAKATIPSTYKTSFSSSNIVSNKLITNILTITYIDINNNLNNNLK